MTFFRWLGSLILAGLCAAPIVLAVTTAYAADGTIVDLSPTFGLVREYLRVGIDALAAAALGWALRWLHLSGSAKAGELADQARTLLHGAVVNGINKALTEFGGPIRSVDVGSPLFASVLAYVQTNAESALDRLGASPEELRNLIAAKLGPVGQVATPPGAPLPFVRASP